MDNLRPWNGIDLITLSLLLAASEEGNLAKAAIRENIALSALSKRIKLLEERFGVELLQRHDRGVRPTATADVVLPKIQSLFALLDQIAADLHSTSRGEMGLIRVQAHMTAMAGDLPDIIASFLADHPNIDVELDEATSSSVVHAVKVGNCDIGLVSGTVSTDDLEHFPWIQDQLVVVLPEGHLLAAQQVVTFAELAAEPFVAMQRDSALLELFRAKAALTGFSLSERTHVTSFDMAKKMVRNGLGVTIIPASSIEENDRGLEVRSLAEGWAKRSLVICIRSKNRLSGPATLLLQHLCSGSHPLRK